MTGAPRGWRRSPTPGKTPNGTPAKSLRAWWTAPVDEQQDAYVVYRAALECEERAAVMLAAAAAAQR